MYWWYLSKKFCARYSGFGDVAIANAEQRVDHEGINSFGAGDTLRWSAGAPRLAPETSAVTSVVVERSVPARVRPGGSAANRIVRPRTTYDFHTLRRIEEIGTSLQEPVCTSSATERLETVTRRVRARLDIG